MPCKLTMSLVSESQEGNCGDDWKYDLDVKVFHQGLKGGGQFNVPKHILEAGAVEAPHGNPEPQDIFEGECTDEVLVRMELTATEVDMFKNDVGVANKDVRIECPGAGGNTVTKDVDIAAGVRESPGILNKNSVVTIRVRFTMTCS